MINNATMEIYTVSEWQENWEDLLSRVQNGERIGVENENGNRAVMMPADDELLRIYTDHDEAN
jgi:PHD/YefM family antitoxin component YafN of YafNO toxin-antitoxin module